jgi:glycosyltransferase involved in cell wall biosynthesis
MSYRVAALLSHPVQYHTAVFRELAKAGIDLKVYFASDFGMQADFDPQFNRKVDWGKSALEGFSYEFLKNWSPRNRPGFLTLINPGIIRELRRGKYDALMVHGWGSVTNWLAFLGAWISGTPILMRGENPWNQELRKRGAMQSLKRLVLRLLFRHIGAFLYIGEENRKFYLGCGVDPAKLFFAPYAVNNERFRKAAAEKLPRRGEIRKSLGIPEQAAVVLAIGKLIDKKRPMDLLRAFEMAAKANPDKETALVFVGDGILRSELEDYVRKEGVRNVVLAGFRSQEELPDFCAAADVIALPSGMGETWGVVLNEAMNFGAAPVVSDLVGSGPDLVRDNGFVVPVGDVGALAASLGKLIKDPEKLRLMQERSIEIIARYSYKADVEGTIKALQYVNEH